MLTCRVVTQGIKANCDYLIEHTVRNVEHCTLALVSGVLIRAVFFSYLHCLNLRSILDNI